MGFHFKRSVEQVAVVLFLGCLAVGASREKDDVRISVLLNNSATVSASILRRAEVEAAGILRTAGTQVDWIECQSHPLGVDVCGRIPGANEFVIHIVATGRTSKDSVFGVAFLGENGTGKYCNVFFDRMAHAADNLEIEMPELLGTVMAHELGHLLLGSQAHSSEGLMRPIWDAHSLAGIGMGRFLLTHKQSLLIKDRLRKEQNIQGSGLSEGD